MLVSYSICAQQIAITGRVIDANTLEPIAFANVYFPHTHQGTVTDFEGHFRLETEQAGDSLKASFIGYKSVVKPIEMEAQTIHFHLTPSMVGLDEVVVYSGENPALAVMRKVKENKAVHNSDRLDAFTYQSYVKTQVFLRRLFDRKATPTGVFAKHGMAADTTTRPALPVYLSETFSDVYRLKSPRREKVVVKAIKTNSLADIDTDILTQLIQKNTHYHFYDNYVRILDKNFISPISDNGLFYYDYYLNDSLYIDTTFCYQLRLVPKREEDLVFSGTIWISKSDYALRRISVEVGEKTNLNFVNRIQIQQDLSPTPAGTWYPAKTRIMADAINIFIRSYIANTHFESHEPHALLFYDAELQVTDTAYQADENVWRKTRTEDSGTEDEVVRNHIGALQQMGRMRFITGLVNMSVKGYYNLGQLEIGPYLMVYNYNELEKHRFQMGLRTNSAFSKKWMANAHLAYGTGDGQFKYHVRLERFLSRKSWTKAGAHYTMDVERLGARDAFYSPDAFLSFAHAFGGADKMNHIRTARLWLETDLFRGFSQKIIFKNKSYSPASSDYFFAFFADDNKTVPKSHLRTSEITFTSIYQPRATFIIDKNERIPVALKKAPVFTLNYHLGVGGVFGSDFDYHKASIGIRQTILLGGIGLLTYNLNLAKSFTPLPYPLLIMFPANESVFRTENSFNLMRYGEFIADKSLTLFLTFRQEGFILDKIPLIKRLRLRSAATLGLAGGGFDHKVNGVYDPVLNPKGILSAVDAKGHPITMFNTLESSLPYVEVSYGIENIFRLIRLDAFHRLTYLEANENGEKPKAFGLKLSAVFRF